MLIGRGLAAFLKLASADRKRSQLFGLRVLCFLEVQGQISGGGKVVLPSAVEA
jgi:hypothetical protein